MKKLFQSKALCCLLVLALCLAFTLPVMANPGLPNQAQATHHQLPSQFTGEIAYDYIYYLSEVIGSRIAATEAEVEAAEYIYEEFESMGFEPYYQPFTYVRWGTEYESQNVIAVKPGRSSETVILGAHYDSVRRGTGASDNASGVGVMLELAPMLKDLNTHANIKLIAFGAEEVGLRGSRQYVDTMTEEEIADTVAMVNMDMVGGVGDYFYVYAGLDGPTWVREMALNIGHNQGIDIRTTPDTNWGGYTGNWSDHAPFVWAGIPVAYFEHWNWELDPYSYWGTETEEYGDILHTEMDTIEMIDLEEMSYVGKVVGPLVYELAKTPLRNTNSEGVGKNAAKYKSVDAFDRAP